MKIILMLIMAIATFLFAIWFYLFKHADNDDCIAAAYGKILGNLNEIEKLEEKDRKHEEAIENAEGLYVKLLGILYGRGSDKKIEKLKEQNEALQHGDFSGINLFSLPGYAAQERFEGIMHGSLHKTLLNQCKELYGVKYAEMYTRELIAKMISYPIIGAAISLALGSIIAITGELKNGLLVMAVGIALALVLTYVSYDDVREKLNKRRSAITRQFPNVVSKLALLTSSGKIVLDAWKETAYSSNGELYKEMQKTSQEIDNLLSPVAAFGSFIDRCNTKETTKLASSIMQSLTKDSSEIAKMLKAMAHESWQERRHNAKRDSEKANSKLMIPTLLLFGAILFMIMAPIALTLSDSL